MSQFDQTQKSCCLVTGAGGFVGGALVPHLKTLGHAVSLWPRSSVFDLGNATLAMPSAEWVAQMRNIDVVVHLAGVAHQPHGSRRDERYFRINRDATLQLATAAHAAGVKRFIFLSSAKVFGEGGAAIYSDATTPNPQDAYAQSKWEAEQLLIAQFARTMEIVILRTPLVYGRDAKANFANLVKLARLPIPLPFAGIDNQRAMIGIDNLIDLITSCLTSPVAAGKTLLCADAQLYSLTDTLVSIRGAMDRDPNLFRLPSPLLVVLKGLLGAATSARLFGNFKIDCSKTYQILGWRPPFTMEQTLRGNAWDSR